MEIIADNLKEQVVSRHFQPDCDRTLVKVGFHVPGRTVFEPNTLYMISSEELQKTRQLPRQINLCVVGSPPNMKRADLKHINLINLGGDLTTPDAANLVLEIFYKYQALNQSFNLMVQRGSPLQEIIDLATEIVGYPLCMIDTFHNVLALSSKHEPVGDKFWEVMKAGFGYANVNAVQESEPKLSEMVEGKPVEMISNIGGNMIRVTLLGKNGRPIAALGMHKDHDGKENFDKSAVHLYEYVIDKLLERLQLFSDVKVGRGLVFEETLSDILDGRNGDIDHLHRMFQELTGVKALQYQLGVISFIDSKHKTDLHLTVASFVEVAVPNTRCVTRVNEIIMVSPSPRGWVLDSKTKEKLVGVLKRHHCVCVMSHSFTSLDLLPKVSHQLHDISDFLNNPGDSAGGKLFHYHDFVKMHAIKLLSHVTNLETISHPAIEVLKKQELKKNIDYLHTLKVFLRTNCRITQSAKLLNMHRNSLINRINQIEDLLGASLEDWNLRSQLIFSFDCEDYKERYLKSD